MENKKKVAKKNVPASKKEEKKVKTKVNTKPKVEAKNKVEEKVANESKETKIVDSPKEGSRVRKGSIKGAKLGVMAWSKTKTAIVASLLIVVILGCFGTTGWLIFTQFRTVEITATSYVCKVENGQEKEVKSISQNTAKLSIFDQGKGKSVANMGNESLLPGQYLKIVYDLNNAGPKDITLRFEIVATVRDNFDISLKKGEETTTIGLLGYLYDVDLKKGETSRVIFYIKVNNLSSGADCEISISNSFSNKNGGSLWTLFK